MERIHRRSDEMDKRIDRFETRIDNRLERMEETMGDGLAAINRTIIRGGVILIAGLIGALGAAVTQL